MADPLPVAQTSDGRTLALLPAMANRHGLITGATGTGKTVSLQVLTEQFSRIGVPSFLADVKGDLAGLAMPGSPMGKTHEVFSARAAEMYVALWLRLFGALGTPMVNLKVVT